MLATGFVLAYSFFVLKVGGDFMYGRFLIPVVPFLAVLLDLGLLALLGRRPVMQSAATVMVALALVFAPSPVSGPDLVHGIADEPAHYPEAYLDQIRRGAPIIERYLRGLDVTVAFTGSEARLMYEARVPRAVEAETGLTDRFIARQPPGERGRVGHADDRSRPRRENARNQGCDPRILRGAGPDQHRHG